jgi:hypothetical protein
MLIKDGTYLGNMSSHLLPLTCMSVCRQVPPGAVTLRGRNELIVGDVSPNYEQNPWLAVTVTSTDNGRPPLQVTHTLRIPVGNVNEPPTKILFNNGGPVSVREDAKVGTIVVNISVVDPDNEGVGKDDENYFFCMMSTGWEGEDEHGWPGAGDSEEGRPPTGPEPPFQHGDAMGWNPHTRENNFLEVIAVTGWLGGLVGGSGGSYVPFIARFGLISGPQLTHE